MAKQRAPRLDLLTPQRKAFVTEYLIDFSPGAAAVRAGYNPLNASVVGASLLKLPPVHAAIQRAKAERAIRTGLNADRIDEELGRMLLGDNRRLFHEDGTVKSPHELSEDDARMIAGVKTRRIVELGPDGKLQQAEIQEVKIIDKTSLMRLAMQRHNMLKETLVHEMGETLAKQFEAAQMRTGQHEKIDPNALTAEERQALVDEGEGDIIEGQFEEVEQAAPTGWEHLV